MQYKQQNQPSRVPFCSQGYVVVCGVVCGEALVGVVWCVVRHWYGVVCGYGPVVGVVCGEALVGMGVVCGEALVGMKVSM